MVKNAGEIDESSVKWLLAYVDPIMMLTYLHYKFTMVKNVGEIDESYVKWLLEYVDPFAETLGSTYISVYFFLM